MARRSQRSCAFIDTLESRRLLAASPHLSLPDEITLQAGRSIHVPISGSSASGKALAFAVNSVKGLSATFRSSTNTWLELDTSLGSMRFQLFDDLAPETSARIRGLAEGGFYDGLTFHRVYNANGFEFAQTGSPSGDGTDGPAATFDDEFNKDAIFNTSGLLAMANPSVKDSNRSQFFITGSDARHLDFNHTIFGMLVRGGKTLDTILNAQVDASLKPSKTITIRSARVVESDADAVLQIRAVGNKTGERKVTVTATDSADKKRKETIRVTVVPDVVSSPPILETVDDVIYAQPGATVRIPIRATNVPGDRYEINAVITEGSVLSKPLDDMEKYLELKLDPANTGPVRVTIGVKGIGAVSRGGITLEPGQPPTDLRLYDTQQITVVTSGSRLTADAPETIHAYPNVKLDGQLIASFTSADPEADADEFTAKVEWGDGDVTADADVRAVDGGFEIYGTHTYSRAAGSKLPLRVRLSSSESGAVVTLKSDVVVANELNIDDETGVVRISGSNGDDDVRLRIEDDELVIRIGNDEERVAMNRVERIVIELFGGNDRLKVDDDRVPGITVDAGEGDDEIEGGSGTDTIYGGPGKDRLLGNGGDDFIYGGDGNDYILGGAGKNRLFGEGDDDRVIGSNGPDSISGGDGADKLYGRGGDDTLDGGGGSDRLYGNDGNDLLIGGGSNDRLYAGAGRDTLYGNAGSDTLDGGEDDDERGDDDDDDVIRSI